MTLLAQFAATGGSGAANYIEDVFSTWIYTGNNATQTITNGIDLSGKGGLVWTKTRTANFGHYWVDTVRGVNQRIQSETTGAQAFTADGLNTFNSNGYSLGTNAGYNFSGDPFVSWTFREQPKFFDVVTYTGTGANRTVAHNLDSVPGCIIVKRTDTTADWQVYHQSNANTQYMVLNTTAAVATGATRWNSTTPTSTVFSLGTDATVNASGGTYVAYIFAHNAGGFGLTGSDNVISCGGYTVSGNVATVTLGYEPQWTLTKRTDSTDEWRLIDVMRGSSTQDGQNRQLYANVSDAEGGGTAGPHPTATGFTVQSVADGTYIYIAIRRGPMKVPTTGTSVYTPVTYTGDATSTRTISAANRADLLFTANRNNFGFAFYDRLRGNGAVLYPSTTGAENSTDAGRARFDINTGYYFTSRDGYNNDNSQPYIAEFFTRAPGFFDEVCYTGTTPNLTVAHNLQAIPELMIIKQRGGVAGWAVFANLTSTTMRFGRLDLTNTVPSDTYANQGFLTGQPTASSFTLIGASGQLANNAGSTYVAYLFATCPGVSKVGTFTGTGTTLQINCGFAAGARFVLIKRTDSTGDWYVWDSARGIVAGNDPYLLLNSTAAEVTSTDYVDTFSAGFELTATAPAAINANGGTYIFLAIA
jgi:hypothetical protein